jgi:hypothetical protein
LGWQRSLKQPSARLEEETAWRSGNAVHKFWINPGSSAADGPAETGSASVAAFDLDCPSDSKVDLPALEITIQPKWGTVNMFGTWEATRKRSENFSYDYFCDTCDSPPCIN